MHTQDSHDEIQIADNGNKFYFRPRILRSKFRSIMTGPCCFVSSIHCELPHQFLLRSFTFGKLVTVLRRGDVRFAIVAYTFNPRRPFHYLNDFSE
jgi:hypothetical protein